MARRFAGPSPPKASRVVVNSLSRTAATISRAACRPDLPGRVEARPRSRDRATCGAVIVLVVIVVLFLFVHVVFLLFVILSS
jgi:hypothetical protein